MTDHDPQSKLSLSVCRYEPDILLRAKQEFMKTDSATDLEWVFLMPVGNCDLSIHSVCILNYMMDE